jgi:glycosyltransferase involved in cell wall biosynthesis
MNPLSKYSILYGQSGAVTGKAASEFGLNSLPEDVPGGIASEIMACSGEVISQNEASPGTGPDAGIRTQNYQQPLSIVHVGPCLFRGGAEQHLIDLARFLDPKRAVLKECLITDPNAIDVSVVRDLPCPARAATSPDIKHALQTADIVLHWGTALDKIIEPDFPRRAISIYIAHGDSPWTLELLKRSTHSTDHAIAVSQRVKQSSCGDFPTTVIHNGVDTARLAMTRSRDAVREELGFVPDDFVVGYVGRYSPEKRPELLIDALAQLPRTYKALFVGWGPMQADLMSQANARIPNRYAFRFSDRYLGDYYQAFDAFALMSTMEGFALVFLEAMFSGLPVIATPVGAVPEVINSMINGIIADRSGSDLAHHLTQLQANRSWARAMGEAGRQYAMAHGHALRMANEYQDLFNKLVSR